MGQLTPGATYIYEHVDGITYAREFGSTERKEIGRTYERTKLDRDAECKQLVNEVLVAAETNPTLQRAIDRVIMIHNLSKTKHE